MYSCFCKVCPKSRVLWKRSQRGLSPLRSSGKGTSKFSLSPDTRGSPPESQDAPNEISQELLNKAVFSLSDDQEKQLIKFSNKIYRRRLKKQLYDWARNWNTETKRMPLYWKSGHWVCAKCYNTMVELATQEVHPPWLQNPPLVSPPLTADLPLLLVLLWMQLPLVFVLLVLL